MMASFWTPSISGALIVLFCATAGASAFGYDDVISFYRSRSQAADASSFSSLAHNHIHHRSSSVNLVASLLHTTPRTTRTSLYAKKSKKTTSKKKKSGGGGFGAANSSASTSSTVTTISADKDSLEKQWDSFASTTNLEIRPVLDEDDPNYRKFEVTDVFVRVGSSTTTVDASSGANACRDDTVTNDKAATGWYRVGKVVAADDIAMEASLSLQRGLILWTAAHMWPELVAKGGKKGAQLLELGYMRATMYMASDSDPPLDDEEADELKIVTRASSDLVKGISPKDIGFRPDFNPPGFTYKRREKAAMKKKKSNMEEILEVGVGDQ